MAKYQIEWSLEARQDLIDILQFYTERNQSTAYSIKLNSEINNSINRIAINPFIGKQTNYKSVRVLIEGNFEILYEIFDHFILIIMIWDSRRNPKDKNIGDRKK
ncbi:MAG: type II toxin-antitoxin system RelE/ParE family toxin [Bacteroidales bacterium]|nr:type II toxin-antitoxin system RelE/ParE family toxin [Bacteroidales bacterium]